MILSPMKFYFSNGTEMNPIYNTIYLQLYMELIITFIFQINPNQTLTNIYIPKLYYILAISPMIPKYCLKIYYFFFFFLNDTKVYYCGFINIRGYQFSVIECKL